MKEQINLLRDKTIFGHVTDYRHPPNGLNEIKIALQIYETEVRGRV